jgi:hypothetical protein
MADPQRFTQHDGGPRIASSGSRRYAVLGATDCLLSLPRLRV